MPLELASLIVDDYDTAIEFFTGTLGFVLAEDTPSTTTDGRPKRWVVVRPARDESYGRVCVFRDPWGNLWDLLGAPAR